VGYVFSADDPFTGIDLDGCLNPQTGELASWAQDIVQRMATYAEVSPSGTGVKLWVRARMSGSRHKKRLSEAAALEVYDQGRFFTVTGRHADRAIQRCPHCL
jgi:primase-polymerase (primpol)-like protein